MFHQLGVEIPKLRKSSLVGHKKIVEEKFFTRAFFRHLWRYAFFLSDFTFHHIFHIFQIKYGLFFHTKHENGWKCNEWSITLKWEWAKKARKTSMTLCAFFTSISCVKDLFFCIQKLVLYLEAPTIFAKCERYDVVTARI